MENSFKTILNEGKAEIVEKKSRFIANIKPVKSEEEAKAFIEEIKKIYWDAGHHVFAYQIGEKNTLQRFSDDGEPQGTAGMPVLSVLAGEDIKNSIIVVTRYYGGTLLGTGGLVRAYGKCAKEALLNAGIADVDIYKKYSVTSDYSLQGKIQYEILQGGHILKDTVFTDKVEFIVLVKNSIIEDFENKMIDVSSGRAVVEELGVVKGAFVGGKLKEI